MKVVVNFREKAEAKEKRPGLKGRREGQGWIPYEQDPVGRELAR